MLVVVGLPAHSGTFRACPRLRRDWQDVLMERWPDRLQPWLQIVSWIFVSAVLIVFVAIPSFESWARLAAIAASVIIGYAAMFLVTGVVFTLGAWLMTHRRVRYGEAVYPRGRGRGPDGSGGDGSGGAGVREPRRPYPSGPPPAHQALETGEADTRT